MNRRDEYFDAMLRNLGAAYYQTTRGTAEAADVAAALDSVAEEDRRRRDLSPAEGHPTAGYPVRGHHRGRWRVQDVMTTRLVTISPETTYHEAVRLMTGHKVNALPVVDRHGQLAGMVSEADLLRKQERSFSRFGTGLRHRTRRERAQAQGGMAGELMTSPAITIHPTAPLGAAARLMNGHNIRRLPVVDHSGKLIGIVSRRDLLSVFLRPDEEITTEVRHVLSAILLDDSDAVSVATSDGVVTLSGTLAGKDLIPAAVRLASDVDGVVSVDDRHLQGVTATAS